MWGSGVIFRSQNELAIKKFWETLDYTIWGSMLFISSKTSRTLMTPTQPLTQSVHGFFPGWDARFTTQVHPAPKLKIRGAISLPPPPLYASMAWRGTTFVSSSIRYYNINDLNFHIRTVQLYIIKVLFIHQPMHKWVVIKTILKFTLKQLQHISVQLHHHQGAYYMFLLELQLLK